MGQLYQSISRSNFCIGLLYRSISRFNFCIGRLYRSISRSDFCIGRLYQSVSRSDFCIGLLYRSISRCDFCIRRLYRLLSRYWPIVSANTIERSNPYQKIDQSTILPRHVSTVYTTTQGFFNSTRIVRQTQHEPQSNIFLWFGNLHCVVGTDSLIHRSVYWKA